MTRWTAHPCWTLLLTLACACACEPEPEPASARKELERGLQVTNLVASLVRGSTLGSPALDWSSTQALEQSAREDLKGTLAGSTCPTVAEEQGKLRLSFNDCLVKALLPAASLRLRGVVVWEARAEVSASPSTLETTLSTQGLTITPGSPHHPFSVSGLFGMTRHRNDPSRLDIESQATLLRVEEDPLDLRFYVAGSASGFGPCVSLEGLGYTEGESRFVVSPRDLRYCTQICPDSGDLAIAGHHFQRLRFAGGSAALSLDEGPYAPVQHELPCSALLP